VYQRILVPHDGSSFAERVIPHVTELAQRFNAELILFEVIPAPNPALYAADAEAGIAADLAVQEIEEAQDELRVSGQARLESLVSSLAAQGIRASYNVVDGDPAHEINAFARANQIDLIAMTSHGRTGLVRAILGSVSDLVLREATTPVLIVRASED
jgi:nucleotide-binding universal stress UspA family protein